MTINDLFKRFDIVGGAILIHESAGCFYGLIDGLELDVDQEVVGSKIVQLRGGQLKVDKVRLRLLGFLIHCSRVWQWDKESRSWIGGEEGVCVIDKDARLDDLDDNRISASLAGFEKGMFFPQGDRGVDILAGEPPSVL